MKQVRLIVAAVVATLGVAASAAYAPDEGTRFMRVSSGSPLDERIPPNLAFHRQDEGTPPSLIAQHRQDEGTPPSLMAQHQQDEGTPPRLIALLQQDEGTPPNLVG